MGRYRLGGDRSIRGFLEDGNGIEKYLYRMIEELRLQNYSQRTVKAYTTCLKGYFGFLEQQGVRIDEVDVRFVRKFLLRKYEKGASSSTTNLYLNAIKFFYVRILKVSVKFIDVKFARRRRRMPVVLSREEIKRILNVIDNKKHKLLISLAYGAGLRLSEVVKLRVRDVSIGDGFIYVKAGKGDKDRITVFPIRLCEEYREQVKKKKPCDYVFESQKGGNLSARSGQKIFEKALLKAKISKKASFHSLRHSFATHLIENGTNLRYVQKLMGHSDIRTTEMYTKVTKRGLMEVESPL